jgi:hypothetical protein
VLSVLHSGTNLPAKSHGFARRSLLVFLIQSLLFAQQACVETRTRLLGDCSISDSWDLQSNLCWVDLPLKCCQMATDPCANYYARPSLPYGLWHRLRLVNRVGWSLPSNPKEWLERGMPRDCSDSSSTSLHCCLFLDIDLSTISVRMRSRTAYHLESALRRGFNIWISSYWPGLDWTNNTSHCTLGCGIHRHPNTLRTLPQVFSAEAHRQHCMIITHTMQKVSAGGSLLYVAIYVHPFESKSGVIHTGPKARQGRIPKLCMAGSPSHLETAS